MAANTSFQSSIGFLKEVLGSSTDAPRGKPPADQAAVPEAILEALIAHSRPLIKAVLAGPEQTRRAHDLVDITHIPLETVLQVVKFLVERNYVTIVESDPLKSNHLLKATDEGRRLVA
jgi:hypothetical protein